MRKSRAGRCWRAQPAAATEDPPVLGRGWCVYVAVLAVAMPITVRLSLGGYAVSPGLGDAVVGLGLIGLLGLVGVRRMLLGPFLAFVAVGLGSTVLGFGQGRLSGGTLAAEVLKLGATYGYALLAYHLLSNKVLLRLFLVACRWMGVAEALAGTAGVVLVTRFHIHTPFAPWRAVGTLPKADVLGLYLVFCLVCTGILYRLDSGRHRRVDLGYVLTMLVLTLGIVASGTRGSILALLAVVLGWEAMTWSQGSRSPTANRKVALTKLGTLVVATGLGVALLGNAAARIFVNPALSPSVADRLALWRFGWTSFLAAPLPVKLFGLGRGGFVASVARESSLRPGSAHNTLLLLLTETGVAGLLVALVLVAWVASALARAWRKLDEETRSLAGVCWLAGVGMVVQGLTNDITEFRPLWVILGLAYGLARRTVEKAREHG